MRYLSTLPDMNLLLVAATAKEIAPFLTYYRNEKLSDLNYNIDILISGIGLTATTYNLSKQIYFKRPDRIIQAGVAGCFNEKISLGSVVAIQQDTIADESVIELKKLRSLFDLKLVPQNKFPYKKGWLLNPNKNLLAQSGLKTVKAISVNQITTSKQMIRFYKKEFQPVTESMEGAALHYVCLMEKIPFLQLRSISNYIGERNKKKWDMNESITNLNRELIRIITSNH